MIDEVTDQLTNNFAKLIEQPNFNFQLSFYCHLHKRTKKMKKKDIYSSLKMKQTKAQKDLETAVSNINKLEARIEEEEMKGVVCVLDNVTLMHLEMYELNSLTGGIFSKLPYRNKAFLNINLLTSFMHCGRQ